MMIHPQMEEIQTLLRRQSLSGLVGIKSEFESEGVRLNEFTMICSIAKSLGLFSALKIGGAEAKTDIYPAIDHQCEYIIAPMIETSYAAFKCISAYKEMIIDRGILSPKLLINIETETALANVDSIIEVIKGVSSGIVFGRVDFTLSSGRSRSDISSEYINDCVIQVSQLCDAHDLDFVVGGGISIDSIEFLRQIKKNYRLDRFETRKCIIDSIALLRDDTESLLKDCVLFELLWLKYKKCHYERIASEDIKRMNMLEERHLYNINGYT